jgi:asparaginyl-tRNA synthetase
MACAVNDIYTFGPTFRAENSNTSRHLAEFWMVEPELAFADLKDDMDCAEAYLKYCLNHVLENCDEDLAFFEKNVSKDNLRERLRSVATQEFARITYTEAVDHILTAKKKFEFPIEWGADLQSEHERYITEEVFKDRPVIVRDYPKDIKAFYMRLNDDNKTVAAMDVLVPRVGELMGGSQREERLDVLERRIEENGLEKDSYWWYLDLRRYGSQPHAGFGLGFERLVCYVTGVENIRDAIPFPRYPGSAEF